MKFIIIFTRTEQNQRILYKRLEYKIIPETVSLFKKSYLIDYSSPIFIDKKLNRLYLIDVDSGKQLKKLDESTGNSDITPSDFDSVIRGKYIKDFIHSANEDFKNKVIYCILGAIMGFLAGALIINLIMQQQMNQLLAEKSTEVVTLIFNKIRMGLS